MPEHFLEIDSGAVAGRRESWFRDQQYVSTHAARLQHCLRDLRVGSLRLGELCELWWDHEDRFLPVFPGDDRLRANQISRTISRIGKAAAIRVYVSLTDRGSVEYASDHDLRRPF